MTTNKRLAKKRDHQKRQRSAETENERQSRLAKKKTHKKRKAEETANKSRD